MGNFFNSEIIQEELMEINELQTHVYQNALSFEKMEREDQLEHIDELVELLEKQRVMFTRLSLSDDPEAKKMNLCYNLNIQRIQINPRYLNVFCIFKEAI